MVTVISYSVIWFECLDEFYAVPGLSEPTPSSGGIAPEVAKFATSAARVSVSRLHRGSPQGSSIETPCGGISPADQGRFRSLLLLAVR